MRINIINYEEGANKGILSKIAYKMDEELKKLKQDSYVTARPDGESDVRCHINYLPYKHDPAYKGIDSLNITHIWKGYKLEKLKKAMETADIGICMSSSLPTWLAKQSIPKKWLTYVLPAHDGKARRFQVVAILTNVYPDGCKREGMFTELVKTLDKNKWAFRIMGSGWQDILVPLVAEGLQVDYFPEFNAENHQRILESSDYCLYFGQDEGSMAILDATNAGLKTISTPQGFHLDIGLDYEFNNLRDLVKIFDKLSENRVEDWTWNKYVKEHIKIWRKLVNLP